MRRVKPIRDPKHVLITGATSGLGRALAERYAQTGRILSLAGRDVQRLEAVAAACQAAGAEVSTAELDVQDASAMEAWLVERDDLAPIDILFANAGLGGAAVIAPPAGEDGPLARRILSVNTMGVVNTLTPITPRMVARKRGHIVLVGSLQDSIGVPQSPMYCASKAAVHIYADALRRLLAGRGVGVTIVRPGFVDTPMSRSLGMPRPFCWPPGRAAQKIMVGVERGAAKISFPWPLRILLGLGKIAPLWITDYLIAQSLRSGWARPRSSASDPEP